MSFKDLHRSLTKVPGSFPSDCHSSKSGSIYYSQADVVQLAIMEYLLSVGLSFSEASRGLKEIVKADLHYADPKNSKSWMFCWNQNKRSLVLEEFDREKAIFSIDKGQAVIPIYLNEIHDLLSTKIIN